MPLLKKPQAERRDDGIPASLLALGRRRTAVSGTLLFQQEEAAECCFLLEQGEISIRRISRSGNEVELARIRPGEWFGEIILFAARKFPAQAVAVRDSSVLEFGRSAILSSPNPEVSAFFLSLLARKCLSLNRRIEQLSIMDTRERLARYILGLCAERAAGCVGGRGSCSVRLPSKKRDIAAELGMAPETLSRTLRQMEDEGYIAVSGSRLEISSCDALHGLIEDENR